MNVRGLEEDYYGQPMNLILVSSCKYYLILFFGAPNRNRTYNLLSTNQLPYLLSYMEHK